MAKEVKEIKNFDDRWQPKDHNVVYPYEEEMVKSNKKNIILAVVYITLLIGSLFAL